MRISVYPTDAHGHPKLSLRYKPQLVQLEGGTAHLPLHDPSARATPLKPNEWHDMLGEVIAETDDAPVLLDVRNGYEWDVGHFKGAVARCRNRFVKPWRPTWTTASPVRFPEWTRRSPS